jgi:hypothetical protein
VNHNRESRALFSNDWVLLSENVLLVYWFKCLVLAIHDQQLENVVDCKGDFDLEGGATAFFLDSDSPDT